MIKAYCQTDTGLQRSMNQDFVYASQQPVGNLPDLLIVADGMGGHAAGDYASRCAVETMVDYIENAAKEQTVSVLDAAIQAANTAVLTKSMSDREYAGMGTTLVCGVIENGTIYAANVGDSRMYVISDRIEQITMDHSLVEEMVRMGQIDRERARSHPDKNVITRAVGVRPQVGADFFDVTLENGDTVLFCSDGLTNMVSDERIFQIVKNSKTLEEAGKTLVAEANQNGGSDNISVILARMDDSGV